MTDKTAARAPLPAISTPVRFVIAGAIAAAANFLARLALSQLTGYAIAVSLAFLVGMATAFVLNRRFVFASSAQPLDRQIAWFIAINLFALVQTLCISLLLARIVLPAIGVEHYAEAIAHAFGISIPILSSYVGHRTLTFR